MFDAHKTLVGLDRIGNVGIAVLAFAPFILIAVNTLFS